MIVNTNKVLADDIASMCTPSLTVLLFCQHLRLGFYLSTFKLLARPVSLVIQTFWQLTHVLPCSDNVLMTAILCSVVTFCARSSNSSGVYLREDVRPRLSSPLIWMLWLRRSRGRKDSKTSFHLKRTTTGQHCFTKQHWASTTGRNFRKRTH